MNVRRLILIIEIVLAVILVTMIFVSIRTCRRESYARSFSGTEADSGRRAYLTLIGGKAHNRSQGKGKVDLLIRNT